MMDIANELMTMDAVLLLPKPGKQNPYGFIAHRLCFQFLLFFGER